MKKISIAFLQVAIVLLGMSVLVLMLSEPHLEGRNVGATPFEIYFNDPFLAYAYASSVLFFIALYQAFKLLRYIGQNQLLSLSSIKALRTIRHCATGLIVLILGAEVYLFTIQRTNEDDIAGGVAMGLFMIFIFVIVAFSASLSEKHIQKSHNVITNSQQ